MTSHPPTNPNNDAKGISELRAEIRNALIRVVASVDDHMEFVGTGWTRSEDAEKRITKALETAHSSILKALHKAVMEAMPEPKLIAYPVEAILKSEGYAEALDDVATTLNALLQPYKLRKPD